jgi:hypothetical protein
VITCEATSTFFGIKHRTICTQKLSNRDLHVLSGSGGGGRKGDSDLVAVLLQRAHGIEYSLALLLKRLPVIPTQVVCHSPQSKW